MRRNGDNKQKLKVLKNGNFFQVLHKICAEIIDTFFVQTHLLEPAGLSPKWAGNILIFHFVLFLRFSCSILYLDHQFNYIGADSVLLAVPFHI